MRVTLLTTCVIDVIEPDVGVAAVQLLRATGCHVSCNLDQTCCGQPAWNAGFVDAAASVARTTLRALDADLASGAEAVVVPAGSCATMVRVFWPELFERAGDAPAAERARAVGERTRELGELLAERSNVLPDLTLDPPVRVAWHHACHLLRELGRRDGPDLLARVEGCELVDWPEAERCCGFGGLFSFKLPETSVAMADHKLTSLAATGATDLVAADTSCLLHLRGRAEREGVPVRVRHIAEVLREALPT